jgi:hypothetical protein
MKPKQPFVLRETDKPHLEKIPAKLTEPLRLVHARNSYEQVAAELAIPLNTVKTRVHRARERVLRMRLEALQATCVHGPMSFGCTPGVTRCDRCGKVFGLTEALLRQAAE